MQLDPDVAKALAQLPAFVPWYETHDILSQRLAWRLRAGLIPPGPSMSTRDEDIAGPNGHRTPIRIYTPDGAGTGSPGVVYFHGGGWAVGDLEICDPHIRRVAAGTGAVVVSVDYRLAPEYPYPAGLHDCWCGLLWTADNANALGIDLTRLAVAGDSAGAANAASMSLMARDYGGPSLVCQCLWYPGFLKVPEVGSMADAEREVSLLAEACRAYRRLYLGVVPDPIPGSLSALHAADLSGLPYTVLAASYFDPLHDESIEFADRLRGAGVELDFTSFDSMPHGYCSMAATVPSVGVAVDDSIGKLAARLAR